MSDQNYVASVVKPGSVTHSLVGNFTAPDDHNLIVGKGTTIEIHLITSEELKPLADIPICGVIASLGLFRPRGETQDMMYMLTKQCRFCLFGYSGNEIITRAMVDVFDEVGCPTLNGQFGMIDTDCRVFGLHIYDGLFKVMPFDEGHLKEPFDIRLDVLQVLDIKFLYGYSEPTIVVLYKDYKDARHVKTYEVSLEDKRFNQGPWALNELDNEPSWLISVPLPLCGLLIGGTTIVYHSGSASHSVGIPSVATACGLIDCIQYLLGCRNGLLHRLVIEQEKEKVVGLRIELLGETSIASTISYLDKDVVYIGSRYGDSQLVKLERHPGDNNSVVQVLDRYINLGPIVDFSVVDMECECQPQVVTCSGAYKDGSLRIIRNGIGINEQASVKLQGIRGMWSLRSAPNNTFLVVSLIRETYILAMNIEGVLEEIKMDGFNSQVRTLFCHDAVCNQFVQVTSNSVRLVSSASRELKKEWIAPAGYSVNVATANATQVLLAFGGSQLVYLEIGDPDLQEKSCVQLDFDISCMDINPIGEVTDRSHIAAVGMWQDLSVRIYSLPELNLISKYQLEGIAIPSSVLLCSFEGISYLLCALRDGHLLNFVLNISTELTYGGKVALGTQHTTLHTFSSKEVTYVFAASNRPMVIYSSNNKLLYRCVNVEEVTHMCPLNVVDFPDSLAITKEGSLIIGTLDEMQKPYIRSIPLGEHAKLISHQEQSRTFAICSTNYAQSNGDDRGMDFVRLLNDHSFTFKSTFLLDHSEYGCSILSCSFSDDSNAYYCIGTAYEIQEETQPTKGRILVFLVQDGKLKLMAETQTKGAVYSLNAFNGMLIAAIDRKILLYKWASCEDGGPRDLQIECEHRGHLLPRCVQTRGNLIAIGDLMDSITLLNFTDYGAIVEEIRGGSLWMSAVEILDDNLFLGADICSNIFTMRKEREVRTRVTRSEVGTAVSEWFCIEGGYHLGDCIKRFQRVVTDSGVSVSTIIYGSLRGGIGIISPLRREEFSLLRTLERIMSEAITSVGGLKHSEWRSFYNQTSSANRIEFESLRYFLDGDFIETFLFLSTKQMEDISKKMDVSLDDLKNKVEEMRRLRTTVLAYR